MLSLCVKKRNSRRPMSFWGNPSLLHRPGMLSCFQLQPVFTNCSSPDTFLHLLPISFRHGMKFEWSASGEKEKSDILSVSAVFSFHPGVRPSGLQREAHMGPERVFREKNSPSLPSSFLVWKRCQVSQKKFKIGT